MSFLFRFLFKAFGWQYVGNVPNDIKKGVFAVAPHNTWRDFFVGITVREAMHLNIGYIGKSELFKPPFGFVFRALGGIPAYRTTNNNMVDSQVEAIKNSKDMLFALAPEGTRKNVAKLRTGFYYMALGANIPIIMVGFDMVNRKAIFAEPFMPSGDFKVDMKKYFVPFFETIPGFQKDWIKNYKNDIFE